MTELTFHSENLAQVGQACDAIRATRGSNRNYRVIIKREVKGRTSAQNRLYWVAYVQPFGDWLRGHGNTHLHDEMAHEVLKNMFLQESVMNPATGEVMTYTGSTTDLSTEGFTVYLDKIEAFLSTECGMKGFGSNRQTLETA